MCKWCSIPTTNRQPLDGVLIEEGPRRNNDEEGKGCAGEANLECERNILCEESDDKGDGLVRVVSTRARYVN